MATPRTAKLLTECITFMLVLLWSYTALSKWSEPSEFLRSLKRQPIAPQLAGLLFYLLPAVELLAALLLIIGSTRRHGMYLSASMMAFFTLYVLLGVLGAFEKTPCSCGGVLKTLGWNAHLYFNLFFLAVALTGSRLLSIKHNPWYPRLE